MSDQTRRLAALAAGKRLCELFSCSEEEKPWLIAQAADICQQAIDQVVLHGQEYGCSCLCPCCLRSYRIHVSLRGRPVQCVSCGHRWRAAELVERN